MRKLYKLYGIYLPIFLLILPLTVVLRTIALFNDLGAYGHFENDLLVTVSGWMVAAATVFFITYIWVGRRSIRLIPSFTSAANCVPSGLVAVSIGMLGGHLLMNAINTPLDTLSVYGRVIAIAAPILAFISVIYFLLASVLTARRSIRRSDFAIVTLVFICMYVAYLYFDTTLPINAPTRIVDEVAYLAVAVFFLGETRLSLGREKWHKYISFAFIGALLTAYSAIPNLIYYFVRKTVVSLSVYESLLTLSFFVFITAKIFLTPMLTKDEKSRVVTKIIAAAAARAEALEPALPEESPADDADLTDENQITISYAEPIAEDEAESLPPKTDDGEEKEASAE